MGSGLKLKVSTSIVPQEIISGKLQRGKNPKFPADEGLLSDKVSLITAMHRDTVGNTLNVLHLHNKCHSSLSPINPFYNHFNIRSLQVTKTIIMHFSRPPVQNSSVIQDVFLSSFSNHSYFQHELHRMKDFQSSMTITAPQNALKNTDKTQSKKDNKFSSQIRHIFRPNIIIIRLATRKKNKTCLKDNNTRHVPAV